MILVPHGRPSIHRENIAGDDEEQRNKDSEPDEEIFNDKKERSASLLPQQPKNGTVITAPVSWSTWGIYILIAVIIVMFAIYFQPIVKEKSCSFEILQRNYTKEHKNLWITLQIGIESMLNARNTKPAVFLLAHYSGRRVTQLIKDIAVHSAGCFEKEMVSMESDDLFSVADINVDYGYAIEKYKKKIKEGNVILIGNLNKIPADAARALHSICDTVSPIVKNVVIFLTLTIEGNKEGNANEIAEKTLEEMWGSKLASNELPALITRVTDQVLVLKS